ncbi:MAG: Hsp33 family molecular chaperone HslO [Bacteriovoracaceae bacterium]|nr:Hsp33 family molecular chaperone HslO [Bacteriovoracaceae bacterium]
MLNNSRLLSFLDKNSEFTLNFVEGQKVVQDLAFIHDLKGDGFAYFRDSVLSFIPLITLLKLNENLGLYIDSKSPYFLLKIEMSEHGHFRTLLLPETFEGFPEKLNGEARLSKISVGQSSPYTSIIDINGLSFLEVVNNILRSSYQIKGRVIISEQSDQAAFIMQLPRKNWDKEDQAEAPKDFDTFINEITPMLEDLFSKGTNEESTVVKYLEDQEFTFLTGKDLIFKCNCSYERMVSGVGSLLNTTPIDEIYKDDDSIETRCDYCKTFYQIPKSVFLKS